MKYLVLDDFSSLGARLTAGSVIDDATQSIPLLVGQGACLAPIPPQAEANVAAAIQAYTSQRGAGERELVPYGSMLANMLSSNAGASFVNVLSGVSVQDYISSLQYANQIVYTDAPSTLAGHYTDWNELYAAYDALPGPVRIVFEGTLGALTIPAGTWQFRLGDVFAGAYQNIPSPVNIADGVVLRDIFAFADNLNLYGNSTGGPCMIWEEMRNTYGFTSVILGLGAQIANNTANPMVEWDANVGASPGGPLLLSMSVAGFLGSGTANPVIHVQPGGAYASVIIINPVLNALVYPNAITGDNGPGTAVLQAWIGNGSGGVSDLPNWNGAPYNTPDNWQVRLNSPPRFSDSNAFLTAGNYTPGVYAQSLPGDEYVRVRPDGSLTPCNVVLPLASSIPGRTIIVHLDNTDVLTDVQASCSGLDVFDNGLGVDMLPKTLNATRRYYSDGSHWMREGSGL